MSAEKTQTKSKAAYQYPTAPIFLTPSLPRMAAIVEVTMASIASGG